MRVAPRLHTNKGPAQPPACTAGSATHSGCCVPACQDVGAAMGTDVRQLRVDGLAEQEVVALDIPCSFW